MTIEEGAYLWTLFKLIGALSGLASQKSAQDPAIESIDQLLLRLPNAV